MQLPIKDKSREEVRALNKLKKEQHPLAEWVKSERGTGLSKDRLESRRLPSHNNTGIIIKSSILKVPQTSEGSEPKRIVRDQAKSLLSNKET